MQRAAESSSKKTYTQREREMERGGGELPHIVHLLLRECVPVAVAHSQRLCEKMGKVEKCTRQSHLSYLSMLFCRLRHDGISEWSFVIESSDRRRIP